MLMLVLLGQIVSSRPPLSPDEAVAVLQSSHSSIDHSPRATPAPPTPSYDWSRDPSGVYVLHSATGEGPFGPFPAYPEPINQPNWTTSFYVGPDFYRGRYGAPRYRSSVPRVLPVVPTVPAPRRDTVMKGPVSGGKRIR